MEPFDTLEFARGRWRVDWHPVTGHVDSVLAVYIYENINGWRYISGRTTKMRLNATTKNDLERITNQLWELLDRRVMGTRRTFDYWFPETDPSEKPFL